MRTNQPAPEHCWEPADNPRSASGWIAGAALQKARFSPLPPFLPLIEISTQYYFNPDPLAPPPPSALPCRLSPPMPAAEALNENQLPSNSVSPRSGAGRGRSWHCAGSAPRVVAAWLSPSLQNAFPPGSVLSEHMVFVLLGFGAGFGAIPPWSIAGVPVGWGTGSTGIWDLGCATRLPSSLPQLSHLQPSQHSLAWIRGC